IPAPRKASAPALPNNLPSKARRCWSTTRLRDKVRMMWLMRSRRVVEKRSRLSTMWRKRKTSSTCSRKQTKHSAGSALENRLFDKCRGRHRRRGCRGELISLDECTGIRLFLILQHSIVLDRDQQERVGDTLLYFVWR